MADIELVIKIDKDAYEARKHWVANPKRMIDKVDEAIANGIPLPKGHGALKDADKLLETWYDDFCEFMTQTELDSMNNIIKNAPTIIEADREDEK